MILCPLLGARLPRLRPLASPTPRAAPLRALRFLLLALYFATGAALAQTYPEKNRPVHILVPSGAATASDLLARSYAKAMAEVAGLNVVVVNRPGAENLIGVQAFMAAPADGYTMMMTSSSSQTLNAVVIPNLPYDPLKDFVPLVGIGRSSLVMNLGPSTQFNSAREFIAAAKAAPGKYTCATSSSTTRMACEFLQATAGINLLNVNYKTTAAALTAIAAGEVDTIFVDVGSARSQWQTGRVRGVATTGTARMSSLANLPTLREEGAPEYDVSVWWGAYFPAKTPPEIAAAMRDILRRAARTKIIVEALNNYSMEPLDLAGEQLIDHNRREIENWNRLIKQANIKIGS